MNATSRLRERAPGAIWTIDYPVRYGGARFNSRMTIVRLDDGRLWIHSPCAMEGEMRDAVAALGSVAYIVAPGTFHYFHVASCQRAFPEATTFICPGLERKRPELRYDRILGARAEPEWQQTLDQIPVLGARMMQEVAFFHRPARTLILVDLVENFGDETPGTNWVLRAYFKFLLPRWNRATPAPEYQIAWGDKKQVGASLAAILDWDFEQVILAHGDVITRDAKVVLREAWRKPLAHAST